MATKLRRKRKRSPAAEVKYGKKIIDIAEFNKLQESNERATALLMDIGRDLILKAIFVREFPKRGKDVEKLMNSMNMIQKGRLAYILELIDGTVLRDLEQIHEIRNRFGHSFGACFSDSKTRKLVKKLSTAKDKSVTEKNCYKFYDSALIRCANFLDKAAESQSE